MATSEETVLVRTDGVALPGDLAIPTGARGIVLFAHGSGSSRFSPRNREVAHSLEAAGLATLLIDLLTPDEEPIDRVTAELRFNIPLLANRLVGAAQWLAVDPRTWYLNIGLFGASTGGGAALMAAAARPSLVKAVVSRGGRPDLAGAALALVRAATLLIVGGDDLAVIDMNREAMTRLNTETALEIVPGATHLFEEPGTLACVSSLAAAWFLRHLTEETAQAARSMASKSS